MYGFCAYHAQSQRCRLRLLMRREEGAHSFPSFETPISSLPSLSFGNLWLVISLVVVQVMLAFHSTLLKIYDRHGKTGAHCGTSCHLKRRPHQGHACRSPYGHSSPFMEKLICHGVLYSRTRRVSIGRSGLGRPGSFPTLGQFSDCRVGLIQLG